MDQSLALAFFILFFSHQKKKFRVGMGRGLWKQSHMGALTKQKFLVVTLFTEGND